MLNELNVDCYVSNIHMGIEHMNLAIEKGRGVRFYVIDVYLVKISAFLVFFRTCST